MKKVTGERIVTDEGRFNASWQRHAACYAIAARFLPDAPVLDVGCGTGHAHSRLQPRPVVAVDVHPPSLRALRGVAADMRALPFAGGAFSSVLCIHAIEHVADPASVTGEVARVLEPGGTAVFVTPNRLTFARPDEIIDPYHLVELDPEELRSVCEKHFPSVEMFTLVGSPAYMRIFEAERERLARVLARDPLRLRRLVPRRVRQKLFDRMLAAARLPFDDAQVTIADFELRPDRLDEGLDTFAVCKLR